MVYFQFGCGCGKPHASKGDSTVAPTAARGAAAPAWPATNDTPGRPTSPHDYPPPMPPRTQEARISYDSTHSSEEESSSHGGEAEHPPSQIPMISSADAAAIRAATTTAAVGVPLYRTRQRRSNSSSPSRRPSSPHTHQTGPLMPVRELPGWEAHAGRHQAINDQQQPFSPPHQQAISHASPPTPPHDPSLPSPITPARTRPPITAYRSLSDPLHAHTPDTNTTPRPASPTTQRTHAARAPSRSMRRAASYDALPPTEPLSHRWDLTFVSPTRERRFAVWYNDHRASFWDVAGVAVLLLAGGTAKSIQFLFARGLVPLGGRSAAQHSKALLDGLLSYVVGGSLLLLPMVALANGTLLSHRKYITRWREPIMAATRLFLMGAALAHRLTHPDLYLARGWLPQSLPATCAASMACLSSLLWPVRWFVHLQLQTMVVVLATVHIVAAYAEPSSAVYKAPWWVTTGAILVLGHVLPTGWLWVEERRLRSSFSPTAGGT